MASDVIRGYLQIPASVRQAGEAIEEAANGANWVLAPVGSLPGQVLILVGAVLGVLGIIGCWSSRWKGWGALLLIPSLLCFALVFGIPGGLHFHPFDGEIPLHIMWGVVIVGGVIIGEMWVLGRTRADELGLMLIMSVFFLAAVGLSAMVPRWGFSPLWWLGTMYWAIGWNEVIQRSEAFKEASNGWRILYQLPGGLLVLMTC